MRTRDWLIAPEAVAGAAWRPIGLLDLDACPADAAITTLPPFPLVGIGDASHPLAARLDAVVEPPVSVEAVVRQTVRAPHAAAALVDLLRANEGMAARHALTVESLCYGLLQGSAEHHAWLAGRPAAIMTALPGTASLRVTREKEALRIVIDRPQARNAIDRDLRDRLHEAFAVAALDPDISSVGLRATGATFSIGADLAEFGVTRDPATAHLIRMRTLPALPLLACGDRLEVHVQGGCIGAGLEMAAFARRLTAAADAWFQLPELAMGIVPGAGGCVSVPRRIGRQRTALMILSGRRIKATTALRWGLIDGIEDADAADEGRADETGG